MMTNKNRKGFTLAEVLITLAIIGVVAALTIPPLVQEYKTRSWNTSASTFERKFGEALKIMDSQNILQGYSSTKAFVNELQNHFRILKVCDKVTDCFMDKIILSSGKTLDVSTLTTAESLGRKEFGTETVGLQFANGISAVLAYNPNLTEKIADYSDSAEGKFHNLKLKTGVVSMIYDVSGSDIPNTLGADIRGINSKLELSADDCTQVGDYCILDIGMDYDSFDCSSTAQRNGAKGYVKYCTPAMTEGYSQDYWAGARKACDDIGLKLPDQNTLLAIYALKGAEGVPASGIFWTSSTGTNNNGVLLKFSDGSGNNGFTGPYRNNFYNALCIK